MNTDKKKSVKACAELVEVSVSRFSFIRGAPQGPGVSFINELAKKISRKGAKRYSAQSARSVGSCDC